MNFTNFLRWEVKDKYDSSKLTSRYWSKEGKNRNYYSYDGVAVGYYDVIEQNFVKVLDPCKYGSEEIYEMLIGKILAREEPEEVEEKKEEESNEINKSQLFKRAWELARELARELAISVRNAFGSALSIAWAELR